MDVLGITLGGAEHRVRSGKNRVVAAVWKLQPCLTASLVEN